jgi:IMP dehydrogenase/GMP reductase
MKYSYNDVTIVPRRVTNITSRSECNPLDKNGKLPIFTAPMSSIIDTDNFKTFDKYFYSILPRSESLSARLAFCRIGRWVAFSLKEFEDLFVKSNNSIDPKQSYKVLIDIANGHMIKLLRLVQLAKDKNPNLIIMAGNIANPQSVIDYCNAGIDYIRLGIGSGAGCLTTSNVGIHYPMASLIADSAEYINQLNGHCHPPKLIADGGIRNYNDVIKALALGADYVMIGGLLAKMAEACGDTIVKFDEEGNERRYHQFYGMASAKGQCDINGSKIKTSEGVVKLIEIEYTLDTWCNNMTDYLKSAMSYCDSYDMKEFKDKANCIVISNNTYNSVNR